MSELSDFYYETAQKTLNEVDPVPPAPNPSPCVPIEAQDSTKESAGSPYLTDWATDTRPSHKLSDVELVDKMRWQLESLRKREVLTRAMQVPTIYPEAK